jgi:hypothetical protein
MTNRLPFKVTFRESTASIAFLTSIMSTKANQRVELGEGRGGVATSATVSPELLKAVRTSSAVVAGGRFPTYKRFENSISMAPTAASASRSVLRLNGPLSSR